MVGSKFIVGSGDFDGLKLPHWKWSTDWSPAVFEHFRSEHACLRIIAGIQLESPFIHMRVVGIGGVFTAEEHRGQGHGRRIVGFCLENRRHLGCAGFVLYCRNELLPFYAKLGFEQIGRNPNSDSLSTNLMFFDPRRDIVPTFSQDWRVTFTRDEHGRKFKNIALF